MTGENLQIYSFEYLMEKALSNVPDNVDKRQGSIIYDAIAPAVTELAVAYTELYNIALAKSAADATDDDLTEIAYQAGIIRGGAVKAQRKAVFNTNVSIGDRFSTNGVYYTIISKISDNNFIAECEQAGTIGNLYFGDLIPISNVELTSAQLTDIIIPGSDEESDDELRKRFKESIITPPQDANAAQYKKWAEEYDGIGAVKIFPLWNGGNSVKICITNSLYQPASSELVNLFQNYMDPGSSGLGNGVAPIGSKVTVSGGTQKDINVSANVTLASGYVTYEGVADAISKYLSSIVYNKNYVSYIRLGSAILDCPSISDITDLKINGVTTDILISGDEIPVLNSLNLVVM